MLAASLLTGFQSIVSLLLYGGVLLWALAHAPWVELAADTRRQHLLYGSVFLLCVLWLMRREFDSGLTFHFIGMTAVTLLLDWPLAIVAGTLAQVAMVILGMDDAAAFGANGLVRILGPVAVTIVISQALERSKPSNLFLYIFISGFFAASFAAVAAVLLGMGMLGWSGNLTPPDTLVEFFGYMLLVMFPEAFINGMIVSGLVVFCPEWVETFNADRYFQEPHDKP
ncbi:energy-coupling factor ABC transporter permease [Pseudomonas profundi]|uniref:energy-coupling factor ABC transporter permease n=1 Tax=Pseudomonas profundi TaxID=1981513 RepID=UPI00123C2D58|nr:energy-coupling factor ABC transporter permease [Pseudomonas profundi]